MRVPSLRVTRRKYCGFKTPSSPSVSMTLLELMKNQMPSLMAAARSISIMTSHEPRMPDTTPSSLGMPGAKWIWFLVILFRPPSLIRGQNFEKVPWTTTGQSDGSVILVSSSSVLMTFMEWPWVARMNLWCFLSSISKRFLSLLSTMCLILSSSTFLQPFLLRNCITSSSGTQPLDYMVRPSSMAPCLRIQERVLETYVSPPPLLFLSLPLCIILLLYS